MLAGLPGSRDPQVWLTLRHHPARLRQQRARMSRQHNFLRVMRDLGLRLLSLPGGNSGSLAELTFVIPAEEYTVVKILWGCQDRSNCRSCEPVLIG